MRSIEMKIPPINEYITAVRYTAAIYANSLNFDIETIEDIKLVVGEACNNAVLYGDTSSNEVFIKFYSNDKSMIIDIIDKGYGFNIDNYENPDLDDPKSGGLGLYIIKTLSDNFEIKSDSDNGTVLSIFFDLK